MLRLAICRLPQRRFLSASRCFTSASRWQPQRQKQIMGTPALCRGAAGATGGAAGSGREQLKQTTEEIEKKIGPDSGEVRPGKDNVQFTWHSAVLTCLMGGGVLWYWDYLMKRNTENTRAVTTHDRIGVPKLGGPFELLDRKGVLRTDQDYKGQYLLIYFGFSFCPDICPQEMEKQTLAIEHLEKEFGPIATPVFISIDPKRDTVEVVDEYCNEFHPRIVGLTGTVEQVKKVSRAYRVYYNEGIKTDDQDYLVDHSIIHYFVNRQGNFLDFFGKNMTSKEMANKMRTVIMADKEKEQRRKDNKGVTGDDDE